VSGCASRATSTVKTTQVATVPTLPRLHPHAVEPVAGDAGQATTSVAAAPAHHGHDRAPLAPATQTAAPSRGAPSDAEIRAAIARFQLAVAKYHLDQLNFSGVVLNPFSLPPGQYNVSIASVYTDYGLPVACGGVLHVPELGVANKTLPCGTEVIFVYGRRAVRVPVIDRGPYIAGRTWDLTGATAEALHFPGLGPIKWRLG
jgi:rare lipoprotein A (peptidoglycan hydrolase)